MTAQKGTPRRVAAIDIGTNSVLLLVAAGEEPQAVLERATITRLGQGVDETGVLSDEAVERTLRCLDDYAAALRAQQVEALDVVGTSAMRDARGGEQFRDRAEALLGVRPRVISGDEEAALTFEGALSGLALPAGGDVTVFDVGGGSTEIIVGRVGNTDGVPVVEAAKSLDIGSVRLFERHVRSDPPAAGELDRVRADIRAALGTLPFAPRSGATLVGVAGTVTTLAAIAGQIDPYDGARVHGSLLTRAEAAHWAEELAGLALATRRGLPGLEPQRADVIVVGALIALEVLAWAGCPQMQVSDRGVRWGLACRRVRGAAHQLS